MSSSSLTKSAAGELRAHLARHELRVADIAVSLGVTNSWIYRRLNGEISPTLEEIERICAALDLPVSEIVR